MPIRKPRRDTKATAQAFEALFFPNVIDAIFEHAPRASLLVLRRVCKNWRHRADRLLVRHISLPFQTVANSKGRTKRVTPDRKFPRANWHRTKIAEGIACIDLRHPWVALWVSRLPGVEIIRHQWWSSRRSIITIRSCQPGRPLRLAGTPSGSGPATTLAFTLMCYDFELPDFRMLMDGVPGSSLTVIAIPPLPGTLTEQFSTRINGLVLDRLAQFLGHHLSQSYHRSASFSVTLVNLSWWYRLLVYRRNYVFDGRCLPYSSHFSTTLLEGEERPCNSDADVRAKVGRYVARNIPKEARRRLLSKMTFLSLDEYCDKVGDARLKFETELLDRGGPY